MNKIIISVAPVSAADTVNDPVAIAHDVFECYNAGASMVHLHCRDEHGRLTPNLTHLEKTVKLIRDKCPIIIEISTGGVSSLSIQERCAPCTPLWVECNSLNVGSVNLGEAVYLNPINDVKYCVQQILSHKKTPEIEVFEIGMINTVRELAIQFDFMRPIFFALVLGHKGAMPDTISALDLMLQGLKDNFPSDKDILWGITHAHRADWQLIEAALVRGAKAVRIGFEDSACLEPSVLSKTNAPMVKKLNDILIAKGLSAATTTQARQMLGIIAI